MDQGLRAVLRHRRFRWLTLGRTTGFLGNAIAPIALSFAVLDLTGSVTSLGLVVGLRSIAYVALLLVGGVLADRLPRAVLLQGAALVAAGTASLLAVSVLAGFATVALLGGIGMVNGAVLGGVSAARWLPERALLFGVVLTAVFAAPLLVLGVAPRLAVLVPAAFVAGVAIEQFAVAWDVSLQENVPGDRLARVYSYDMVGSAVALPAGQIAVGPIATAIGPSATLTWGFALVVAVTAMAAATRSVRGLRRAPGRS